MKIKGQATLKKYTVTPEQIALIESGQALDLGAPTFENTEQNIVNKRLITDLLDGDLIWTTARRIAVSSQNTTEDYEAQDLTLIHAVGDETLVTNPYVFTDRTSSTPAEVVYSARFLPPAAVRSINTVAMTFNSASFVDNPGGTTLDTYTQLKLGSTLSQADNEILDISYKIFIDWTGNSLETPIATQRQVEWQFFAKNGSLTGSDTRTQNVAITWNPGKFSTYPHLKNYVIVSGANKIGSGYIAGSPIANPTNDPPPFGSGNQIYYTDVEYGRVYYEFGRNPGDDLLFNDCLGFPLRAILFGNGRDNLNYEFYTDPTLESSWEPFDAGASTYLNNWFAEYKMTKSSNLSNVFSHNDTATSPMYNITALSNSSLKPVFTETVVTPDFPFAYYLRVTVDGGLGVGEYKLFRDLFNNYSTNDLALEQPDYTWMWHLSQESPWTVDPTDETVLWDARWIYAWEKASNSYKYVSYHRDAGLALWELSDVGNNVLVEIGLTDVSWISAGLGTNARIHDVAVYQPGNIVYVATDTGLYQITNFDTSPLFTQLTADETWAVCVGLGGAVFATIEDSGDPNGGRLSSSTGVDWNTDISGTSTIDWTKIWAINIDPDSATYDILIHEGTTPKHVPEFQTATVVGAIKLHWWDNSSQFIQTDSYDYATVGTPLGTTDFLAYDKWYLSHSHAIQVTNGVWIYPTDAYYTEARKVSEGLSNISQQVLISDFSMPGTQSFSANLYYEHAIDLANQGYYFTTNFRHSNEVNLMNSPWRKMGCSKEYAFGKHAATPFHTEIFDGTIGELVLGKQNPSDTSYPLCFYVGGYHGRGIGATVPTQTGRYLYQRFKLNVDELSTSTLVDYGQNNPRYLDSLDDSRATDFRNSNSHSHLFHHVNIGGKSIYWFANPVYQGHQQPTGFTYDIPDSLGRYFEITGRHVVDGGLGPINALRVPEELGPSDFDDIWLESYEWTGSAWVEDILNTGSGKPAHSGSEALIDGLSVQWDELQPGNPQPLIENQWYNIVKITEPNTILCETTSPLVNGRIDFFYRELITATDSGTIPGGLTITIPEAPTGTASDPEWLSLPPDLAGENFSATIGGSDVQIEINSGTPPAGVIYITDTATGEVTFNVADVSQSYVINYFYIRKYHTSEVL